MAASAATTGWLLNAEAFTVDEIGIEIDGLHYTDAVTVDAAINLPADSDANVFTIRAARIERALAGLPAVAAADVRAVLPDRLVVEVVEREPVVGVSRAGDVALIDPAGIVLDDVPPAVAEGLDLPLIDDRRASLALEYVPGGQIDPTELSAILQLGALTPELLESSATRLLVTADDANGYVLTAEPFGWRAIFGHFTPTVRPPEPTIARQVQCLRSLLATDEANVGTVYLAPLDERCGTFEPRSTPRAAPTPEPSA